jgi:membrane protein DedA with SNARE-associated domain
MHASLEFLQRHGYLILIAWVFTEQAGLPLPSVPLLLAAGALAGVGQLNLSICLFSVVLGAVAADTIWYELGRRKGIEVLQWLCRISLEPDSCVRRTEGVFEKHGARSLLFAKFVPGLNTVATPLAGIFHMRLPRFLLFDAVGSLLWGATFLGLGFTFSGQLEWIAQRAASLGSGLLVILVCSLALYILYKFLARQQFRRQLRIGRISVQELKDKIDAGEPLTIVDLRHTIDFEADPKIIPGAFRMDARELQENADPLPLDRDVILYCT